MTDPLVLDTERLRLRPYTPDDLADLHRLWTDPGVRRYLWDDQVISEKRSAYVIESSIADFREHGFGQWAVFPRDATSLIGFCGFRLLQGTQDVELLVGLLPAYWGKGFAVEAASAVLSYGFETVGLQRVVAATDPPNEASIRVMEKLGMRFVRRGRLNDLDTLFYEISRDECESHTPHHQAPEVEE